MIISSSILTDSAQIRLECFWSHNAEAEQYGRRPLECIRFTPCGPGATFIDIQHAAACCVSSASVMWRKKHELSSCPACTKSKHTSSARTA